MAMSNEYLPVSRALVVELGGGVAASYASSLFRGFGATVVKVEPPGGDVTRRMSPFFTVGGRRRSAHFHHLNRGKLSVALDPARRAARRVLRDLVAAADIVLHNVDDTSWPGADDLLEGAARARAYVELTAFGRGGPYEGYRGSDLVLFAASGRMYWHGLPDQPPLQYVPNVAEFQHGLTAAAVASAYLFARPAGPQRIEVSGMEALMGNADSLVDVYAFTGLPNPRGLHRSSAVPCADGYVHIPLLRQEYNVRLCRIIGHPELLEEERFRRPGGFVANQDEFLTYLIPWCLQHTREEIVELLQRNQVMCAPVLSVDEVMEHPQFSAFFLREQTENGRTLVSPGAPIRLEAPQWDSRGASPELGEHGDEVLESILSYQEDEVVDLRRSGVVL